MPLQLFARKYDSGVRNALFIAFFIPMQEKIDTQTPWPVGCETKAPANAPPIDNFPTYDEQPEHSADDYIREPDYPAEAYF